MICELSTAFFIGPHLQDTFAPRKSSKTVRRQNMMLNIEGYKKLVRKCRKQATYRHNLQILCQSREDNPLHTVAFNELIENLKEKNTTWSNTMLNCERSVSRTLFMDENSDRSH
jgi:lipoate synthase